MLEFCDNLLLLILWMSFEIDFIVKCDSHIFYRRLGVRWCWYIFILGDVLLILCRNKMNWVLFGLSVIIHTCLRSNVIFISCSMLFVVSSNEFLWFTNIVLMSFISNIILVSFLTSKRQIGALKLKWNNGLFWETASSLLVTD